MQTRLYHGMYVEVIGSLSCCSSPYTESLAIDSAVCTRLAGLEASRDAFKSTPSHISNAGTADDSTSVSI